MSMRTASLDLHSRIRWSFLLTGLVVVAGLGGCGGSQGLNRPLNQELARKSVAQAMQAWIDGKKPTDLKPDIIVGDPAWDGGRKLVAFKLLDDKERSDGSNLHITVEMEFKDSSGRASKSEKTYIVGTSPVVSIFPN